MWRWRRRGIGGSRRGRRSLSYCCNGPTGHLANWPSGKNKELGATLFRHLPAKRERGAYLVSTLSDCLPVSARLERKQMRVVTVELHELFVAAAFDDAAFLEHDDLIRHAHGGEAMRDQDRDLAFGQRAEMF